MAVGIGTQYFNKFNHFGEQKLIEDLVIESISIYGIDMGYLSKKFNSEGFDELYSEDQTEEYDQISDVTMYLKSVDGFEGEGDFLTKFGLEIRDQMSLCVARRHFEETVEAEQNIFRPREGDLVFLPLASKLFEIQFVEKEPVFYQMGALQFYEIRCELFEYSSQRFRTGVPDIDVFETTYSQDTQIGNLMVQEDGGSLLLTEEGYRLIQEGTAAATGESYDYILDETGDNNMMLEDHSGFLLNESQGDQEDFDDRFNSENQYIEDEADEFIDFSELDPFSEGSL
jgi:hypothetical protein|tara:strand:- start:4650 stop:5504 length:855 start_codon:yes stop_codon:yes gene_type:complete